MYAHVFLYPNSVWYLLSLQHSGISITIWCPYYSTHIHYYRSSTKEIPLSGCTCLSLYQTYMYLTYQPTYLPTNLPMYLLRVSNTIVFFFFNLILAILFKFKIILMKCECVSEDETFPSIKYYNYII